MSPTSCEHAVEFAKKLEAADHRAQSNTRRIEKLELQTDALHDIAASVNLLVAEQKHQTDAITGIKADINKLDGKVEMLERKPGKRWDGLVEKSIWAVVAAVIAFVLANVGL